jgi:hypothetical protein
MAKVESGANEDHIRAYKVILSGVLDQRPSGTRQRLADALGKHRSFVTQISSPAYPTPIPLKHLSTLFTVCHFSTAERDHFMIAYRKAHRASEDVIGGATRKMRHVSLLVPDLGTTRANSDLDRAIAEFVGRVSGLMRKPGED